MIAPDSLVHTPVNPYVVHKSNSSAIPDSEVVVLVVNQSRDTAVGVISRMLRFFYFLVLEITRLIGEPEAVEDKSNLPGRRKERKVSFVQYGGDWAKILTSHSGLRYG